MERKEKRRADALDNYWDGVQRNDRAQRTADLDDLTAAMVALMCQRPATVDALATQKRIRQEIVNAAKLMEAASGISSTQPKPPVSRSTDQFRVGRPLWRVSPNGRLVAALAAVLLLIVAGVGFSLIRDEAAESPAIIPAAIEPSATPTLLESATVLFEFTIPVEQLPPVDVAGSGLTLWTVPPGNSSRWEPTCCPGPLLQYVVAGNYEVTFDNDFQVFRANGAVEVISANNPAALSPGDALIAQNDDVISATNPGESSLEILQWNLIDDDNGAFSGRPVPGWSSLSKDVHGPDLVAAPVEVRLLQVTMPPGTTLASSPDFYLFAANGFRNALGTPQPFGNLTQIGDGSFVNYGKSEITVFVLTMKQAHPAPATPSPSG